MLIGIKTKKIETAACISFLWLSNKLPQLGDINNGNLFSFFWKPEIQKQHHQRKSGYQLGFDGTSGETEDMPFLWISQRKFNSGKGSLCILLKYELKARTN